MLAFAPRISHRLVEAIVRLDDPKVPIAETYRRVADHADRLRVPRPSYQRVRELVHESRRLRARRGPSTASVLLDVTLRARPPGAILEHLSGVGVPELR
ncbi:MAG: hypothetical protein M3321_11670 [Actinomycetota bacterium]|nr:hypothetical protein [Actinomycetota bacterium]